MRYIKQYNEAFKRNIPNEIKVELKECFISLEDIIHDGPNSGIEVSGIANKEYGSLEGYGNPGDYLRVMIRPKIKDISNYNVHTGKYKNQSFLNLSYTPAEIDNTFYDELINSAHLGESTGFKINCVIIAWSNGGENNRLSGEITKKFKQSGVDPDDPEARGPYDIDKLESFLKRKIKDRIRWIKIFYL